MWPWGHLAVGYLLYAAFTRSRYGRRPAGVATIALAVGTQFPDLVDKPLAWTVGVLPTGRTLAHTLLIAIPVCAAVYLLCKRSEDLGAVSGVAFGIGYVSHVLIDAIPATLWGDLAEIRYLLWPLLSVPGYEDETPSLVGAFLAMDLSRYMLFEFGLVGIALAVWWYDGRPGLSVVIDHTHRRLHRRRKDA